MRQDDYDKQIMKVIKRLRISQDMKQFVLADALKIDRTVYCRIEKGEAPFTPSQLKLMSNVLGVSVFQILFIAENSEISVDKSEDIPQIKNGLFAS